jgi:hypothetical protein
MSTADFYAVFLPLMGAGATMLGIMGVVAIIAKRDGDKRKTDDETP